VHELKRNGQEYCEKKTSFKSALKYGFCCAAMIAIIVEAIFELEGKNPYVNAYPIGIALIVGFFLGFLLYYLYSRTRNEDQRPIK
jgi:cytosine/uracil/thiamine/allantoin permease